MKRLKKENQALYFDGQTLIELVEVVESNKENNIATLSNKIEVERSSSSGIFYRKNGKPGYAMTYDENLWESYKAYHQSRKKLGELMKEFQNGFSLENIQKNGERFQNINKAIKEL